MTKKERIAALESQVAELTIRIAALEARPVYWPAQVPNYPPDGVPFWSTPIITCGSTGTGDVTATGVICPSVAL